MATLPPVKRTSLLSSLSATTYLRKSVCCTTSGYQLLPLFGLAARFTWTNPSTIEHTSTRAARA
eukprot:6893626-Pyramimonas_sp.AAC.1